MSGNAGRAWHCVEVSCEDSRGQATKGIAGADPQRLALLGTVGAVCRFVLLVK